ncbi:acyltransferase family protein [Pseudomonas monteilii]|uniref:acyltransferase family protein n=1 Tax=Pseudomonas monteilii TaxID=76759 RepID=UPI001E4CABAA|nr:acyltransferase family protein [Pseudomonas monteilii]MCE1009866.1 acyltransferase [Pseudomonas monteilii]
MQGKHLAYRPDIDGLRAVAVLAVTIFHFSKEWMPGGFVGVDIFFVISGYLITGIVARQMAAGTFSFADFYMRRIRRIFPAALFVTLVTLIAGSALMLPADSLQLSQSAIAATFSAANIFFWKFLDTSYFAASSDMVPLLHMWSLGVEEQFYLVWPALLLLALKFGGRKLVVLTACLAAVASFWYGQSRLVEDPTFAYYMLPSRAGELLIGALAYFACESARDRITPLVASSLAYIGAGLVVLSLIFIREEDGFPGFISAVPAIGAALIIAGGAFSKSLVGKLLALKPMTAVGLISFSLYLWHWPVLALYRYSFGELNLVGGLACFAVMTTMTLVSYFFIEKPFRNSKTNLKTISIGLAAASVCALGLVSIQSKGMLGPFTPDGYAEQLQALEDSTQPAHKYPYVCQGIPKAETITSQKCVVGKGVAESIVIGDSNAAHYMGYFKVLADHYGFSVRNIEHPGCPPFPGDMSTKYVLKSYQDTCKQYNKLVTDNLGQYKTVILGGTWHSYATNEHFEADLRTTLTQLSGQGKNVIIALRVPGFMGYDKECTKKSIKFPLADCEKRAEFQDKGDLAANKRVTTIAKDFKNVQVLGVRELICRDGTCSAYMHGKPLYFDPGHLSIPGSEMLGAEAIKKNLVPPAVLEVLLPNQTVGYVPQEDSLLRR